MRSYLPKIYTDGRKGREAGGFGRMEYVAAIEGKKMRVKEYKEMGEYVVQ
jgi:hypothetical protein